MIVKLLTEHHLEFLRLKGGCRGSSESTLVICHIVGNLMHWLIMFSCILFCDVVKHLIESDITVFCLS